jgi:cellulose synthase/poly-beta-1,6-N-acetylglucosamine synthase-like glycosyltransferase
MATVLLLVLYWTSAVALAYVYAGYPALLALVVRVAGATSVRRDEQIRPRVTLIISAFNEEAVIDGKLRNSLELLYPRDRLEILVVSDCSSDRTDEIVRGYSNQVALLRMAERGGKTAGLNHAVRHASGEILVFSDANAHYDRNAIARLVRNFADPRVGAVTGESRYWLGEGDYSTESENAYWRYELALKKLESALGSLVGGDGAIYAIRKALYVDLDPADLSDFVNPLQIVRQGYRNVYEPEAICHEGGAEGFAAEFRRKVRIVNRACRAAWKMRDLLNPFRHGVFALQFLSHKVLRWMAPIFMVALFASNLLLALHSTFFAITLGLQLAFYALALIGWRLSGASKQHLVFYIPYYFCAVNMASLVAIMEALRGRRYTTWNSSRRDQARQDNGNIEPITPP